jgi:hypothetical protein
MIIDTRRAGRGAESPGQVQPARHRGTVDAGSGRHQPGEPALGAVIRAHALVPRRPQEEYLRPEDLAGSIAKGNLSGVDLVVMPRPVVGPSPCLPNPIYRAD